jgi:antirestriction protein ArdC
MPREKRRQKRGDDMTEEIKMRQTAEEATVAVPAGQQASTVGARYGAERKERKPMVSWAALLHEAVKTPGFIHEAYSRFHNYSLGNQLLALYQCIERGLQPGPVATFPKWKELGRHVKKGEKALTLCMPLACKRAKKVKQEDGTEQKEQFAFTHFSMRPLWFTLAQTEGKDYQPASFPAWSEETALTALKIEREEFHMLDGNTQGYAKKGRKIAVSPVAALPVKSLVHECAHVILGHCDQSDLADIEVTPHDVREVEAEAVALLCCESLGLPGAEYSRGYIQSWGKGRAISERSAQRIFHAADQILRAGTPAAVPPQENESEIP